MDAAWIRHLRYVGNCGASIVQFSKKALIFPVPIYDRVFVTPSKLLPASPSNPGFQENRGLESLFFSLHDLAFPQKCFSRLVFFSFLPVYFAEKRTNLSSCKKKHSNDDASVQRIFSHARVQADDTRKAIKGNLTQKTKIFEGYFLSLFRVFEGREKGGAIQRS